MKLDMNDKCPSCGKKLANMAKDLATFNPATGRKDSYLPQIDQFVLMCTKCGTVFVPRSLRPLILEKTKPRLVRTASPGEGNLIIPPGEGR